MMERKDTLEALQHTSPHRPRVLMASTVPIAPPWNGADKNLAAMLARNNEASTFFVQTSHGTHWDDAPHVRPMRLQAVSQIPDARQKLRSFHFLASVVRHVDLVHVVASYHTPSAMASWALRHICARAKKPLVHTLPSAGDHAIRSQRFPGDVTVVVAEHTRQRLIAAGVPHVVYIPPPVEVSNLQPLTSAAALQEMHQLGAHAMLYPAHYGPDSGIDTMIAAFAQLAATHPSAVLVLACRTKIGQNPDIEAQRVMTLAQQLGVADRVRLLGHVRDMPSLIAACMVTVLLPRRLASKMDVPLVILEALALGRPVILSDMAPMNEALLGGGFAVPPGDHIQLAARLNELLSSDELRHSLAQRGQQAVRTHCHPHTVAGAYQQLYLSLLQGQKQE